MILVNYTAIDFLRNKSVEQFRAYTDKFYEELVEKYPDSNIVMGQLLNPMPNLIRPDRIAAPISPLFFIPGIPFTCKKSFELMKFGKRNEDGTWLQRAKNRSSRKETRTISTNLGKSCAENSQ